MTRPVPDALRGAYQPARPLLAAAGLLSLWIAILALPMLGGNWLAGTDQYAVGYAFREWSAGYIREHGAIPLWNPMMFGGLPYLGAMHGDIFYLTSWLRLVLPTEVVMNLGFVLHYVAAGVLTYVFLRMLGVSWMGAVVGGMAYQLSGVIGSYPAPGHDGKLFVTALLPLALIALLLGMRRNRLEGYALLALTVGLGVVSPHPQVLYYLLVASGIFALYLAFGAEERLAVPVAAARLGGALVAVALGFGIGMVQVLPFYEYIPLSPRADTYRGFEGATSYAIPWSHIPEFFLAGFTGTSGDGTYWAANPLKLHSEYLGLPVIALAMLGAAARDRRRLVLWLGGIGLLFLLVCLGAGTPFYRPWYEVMPFMKKVRAPGMALYVVAFVLAVFAALGAERLERGEGRGHAAGWLAAASAVVVLAAAGVFGRMALGWAAIVPAAYGDPAQAARAAAPAIRLGAISSGIALLALGTVAFFALRGRLKPIAFALLVPLVVGADLWNNARGFWTYRQVEELYAPDPVTRYLTSQPEPRRVLDLGAYQMGGFNQTALLMAHGIPQLLGHHGNELHRFDELLGGKNDWRYLGSLRLWDLYAIDHVLVLAGTPVAEQLGGFAEAFDTLMAGTPITPGGAADVYRRTEPAPYARLVSGAVTLPDEQAIPTIVDPRSPFDPARLVLLDPEGPVTPAPLTAMPDAPPVRAVVERWEPGAMRVRLDPAAPSEAYLVVSENWYPDWRATVDGEPASVIRGNVALITVPVRAGAQVVELRFRSRAYEVGKLISFASLLIVVGGLAVPVVVRRRSAGG